MEKINICHFYSEASSNHGLQIAGKIIVLIKLTPLLMLLSAFSMGVVAQTKTEYSFNKLAIIIGAIVAVFVLIMVLLPDDAISCFKAER